MDVPPEKDPILKGKYPAKQHARRVAEWIAANGGEKKGVIYLEAQHAKLIEDKDQEAPFHQRRYFFYLTGCKLPDCYYTYDIEKDESTLYIPPIDPDEVIWSGLPLTVEEAVEKYDIDHIKLSSEINSYLLSPNTPSTTIYAIPHQISDHITFLNFSAKDFSLLKPAIDRNRVQKDVYEIALIRHANRVSDIAHTAVISSAKNAPNEQNLYGLFLQKCIAQGCHDQAYHSIVASGTNCATLHYVQNDLTLDKKLNVLLDAGAEYECYAADITRTFPISGTFTRESREIYEIVAEMQRQTMAMCRPGLRWEDAHVKGHEVAIEGLLKLGILRGDKEEIMKARTSVAFFPHGLGHYLGMDTHDVGGNPNYSDEDPMFRYLRIRGTVPENAVVTVEPGIYFCRFIVEPYLRDEQQARFIDEKVLERYWEVGGVRIEGETKLLMARCMRMALLTSADDVWITKDGFENLTKAPREIAEIESLMTT
ncbi:MAG: hypothetical protein M1820_007274 [Bogoriella megaspora]|nr:MAG: hypothetical protein M1820_007274 [Bogoriella megaspora]